MSSWQQDRWVQQHGGPVLVRDDVCCVLSCCYLCQASSCWQLDAGHRAAWEGWQLPIGTLLTGNEHAGQAQKCQGDAALHLRSSSSRGLVNGWQQLEHAASLPHNRLAGPDLQSKRQAASEAPRGAGLPAAGPRLRMVVTPFATASDVQRCSAIVGA